MNWMRFKWIYFLLSASILVPGIYSLARWGLRPSIDFSGGTLLEYKLSQETQKNKIEEVVKKIPQIELYSLQQTAQKTYLFRFAPLNKDKAEEIKNQIEKELNLSVEEIRFETVGPTLGKELLRKTIIAIFLAAGAIVAYVSWRFKDKKFGVCAILAMFHDTFVLLGSFSLLGHFFGVEVDTLFVTAVLTVLSFSIHDTVVVYDRIRESQKLFPNTPFPQIVNKAITETIVRSLNNSLTIIFMLTTLLFLGGATIRWFIAALLIGTISGTYSSTFTAAPLLVVWDKIVKRKQ